MFVSMPQQPNCRHLAKGSQMECPILSMVGQSYTVIYESGIEFYYCKLVADQAHRALLAAILGALQHPMHWWTTLNPLEQVRQHCGQEGTRLGARRGRNGEGRLQEGVDVAVYQIVSPVSLKLLGPAKELVQI